MRGDPGVIPVEVEEVHLPGHPALPPHMPVALGEVDPPDLLQPPPPRVPQGEDPGLPGLREEVEPPARTAVDGEIPRGEPQVLVLQGLAIVADEVPPQQVVLVAPPRDHLGESPQPPDGHQGFPRWGEAGEPFPPAGSVVVRHHALPEIQPDGL